MDKLVLIDGHAILHRAFHALPPLTTKEGVLINAVYGFTSMLLRAVADLKPEYLIVTFDRPKPTFRKKIYADYQAKRPKMDEGLVSQIENVHKVVMELGIPIFEKDGFEADDIIGTLALQARSFELKPETIIVTGDRDLLQLVDRNIKVYMPVKGISESKLFGEKEVEEKYGIKPSQIVDYKAIVGDQSDNYPGVPGIGPKTAAELITRFGTLEQLYENIESIESDSLKKKLIENSESAKLCKQLAKILSDAPVKLDLEKSRLKKFDRPEVYYLFEELGFKSLIPRLGSNNIEHKTKNKQQKTDNKDNKKKENNYQQETLF